MLLRVSDSEQERSPRPGPRPAAPAAAASSAGGSSGRPRSTAPRGSLILTRRAGEGLYLGAAAVVTVTVVHADSVTLEVTVAGNVPVVFRNRSGREATLESGARVELSPHEGEVQIGADIVVAVSRIHFRQAGLQVVAPRHVHVLRSELLQRVRAEQGREPAPPRPRQTPGVPPRPIPGGEPPRSASPAPPAPRRGRGRGGC